MSQAGKMSAFTNATARQSPLSTTLRAKTGGKGIRTPDLLISNDSEAFSTGRDKTRHSATTTRGNVEFRDMQARHTATENDTLHDTLDDTPQEILPCNTDAPDLGFRNQRFQNIAFRFKKGAF